MQNVDIVGIKLDVLNHRKEQAIVDQMLSLVYQSSRTKLLTEQVSPIPVVPSQIKQAVRVYIYFKNS